jgi:phage gp36-like protein
MPYTTLAEIAAKLPNQFLVEALDDNGDGVPDADVWDQVAASAAAEVDGLLAMRFSTPFASPPAVVRHAALIFALETLYDRRGYSGDEKNPYASRARDERDKLRDIGAGKLPLTPVHQKPTQSVAVVSEPARTSSAAGHLAS